MCKKTQNTRKFEPITNLAKQSQIAKLPLKFKCEEIFFSKISRKSQEIKKCEIDKLT